ncbi:MAG: hypothetical protein AAFY59_19305 [Pseudomonadota bacterium]
MGLTRFLASLAICWPIVSCTAPEGDTARAYFYAETGQTSFPRLLNAPDLVRANSAIPRTFDETSLAARVAALRTRAAALNGPVLTNAERRRLRRGVRR